MGTPSSKEDSRYCVMYSIYLSLIDRSTLPQPIRSGTPRNALNLYVHVHFEASFLKRSRSRRRRSLEDQGALLSPGKYALGPFRMYDFGK